MGVGEHHEEAMAESEETITGQQVQAEETQRLMEDVQDAVREAVHACVEEKNGNPIFVAARLQSAAHRHELPSKMKRFTFSDAVNWMHHGGKLSQPWRDFLIAAVSIAGFAVLAGVVAIAILFISSSLNAAFATFLVAASTVGFIMAFFFSSLTVVYVGALGFGGLTIGSIAFFSVWAVIILFGWAAIAWVIWQGLTKAFELARHLVFLAGSFLYTNPAAQKLSAKFKGYIVHVQGYKESTELYFGVKFKEYIVKVQEYKVSTELYVGAKFKEYIPLKYKVATD